MRWGKSLMVLSIIWIASCGGSTGPPSETDLADALFSANEIPIEGRWTIDEGEDHEFLSACDLDRFIRRNEPLADIERIYKHPEVVDREPTLESLNEFDPNRVDGIAVRLLVFDDAAGFAQRLELELEECLEGTKENSASDGDIAIATTARRVDDRELPDDYRLNALTWRQVSVVGAPGQGVFVSPNVSELFVDGFVVGLVRTSGAGSLDDIRAVRTTEIFVGKERYTKTDTIVRELLERL